MTAELNALTHLPVTTKVDEGLRNLAEYGVTIHKDFISAAEADALRDRLDEQAEMERKSGLGTIGGQSGLSGNVRTGTDTAPIYQALPSLVNKGRVFIDLFMNPTAHAYASGLFGPHPWLLWGMNGIITRNGAQEQLLHTDAMVLPPEMSTIPALVNCFVCLSDFDEDMGPTGFVLGSHTRRLRYDGDHEETRALGVAKKGSAIIWEGRTWHGQGEHRSPRTRYAIAMSYSLFAFRSGEDYPASLHDSVYETLTEQELRLLGFYTELAGLMNRFGPRVAGDRRAPVGTSPTYVPEMRSTGTADQ